MELPASSSSRPTLVFLCWQGTYGSEVLLVALQSLGVSAPAKLSSCPPCLLVSLLGIPYHIQKSPKLTVLHYIAGIRVSDYTEEVLCIIHYIQGLKHTLFFCLFSALSPVFKHSSCCLWYQKQPQNFADTPVLNPDGIWFAYSYPIFHYLYSQG